MQRIRGDIEYVSRLPPPPTRQNLALEATQMLACAADQDRDGVLDAVHQGDHRRRVPKEPLGGSVHEGATIAEAHMRSHLRLCLRAEPMLRAILLMWMDTGALVCDAPWALPMVRRAPASAVAPLVPVHWCRRVQNEKSPMAVLPFSSQLSELQMSAQK